MVAPQLRHSRSRQTEGGTRRRLCLCCCRGRPREEAPEEDALNFLAFSSLCPLLLIYYLLNLFNKKHLISFSPP